MMKGNRIAITGVGETPFLRKGTEPLMPMMARSSLAANADAGPKTTDIDG